MNFNCIKLLPISISCSASIEWGETLLAVHHLQLIVSIICSFGSFDRMNSTQNIFTTLPQTLHQSLNSYLEKHPNWDERRLITAAISLFLLQNADGDRRVSQVYLETLFRRG